jgi:hypothetical protein
MARWFVKALGRAWHGGVRFFDYHHGAMTALATSALAVLTFVYITYSKAQWQVMDQQLSAFRAVERANMSVVRLETDLDDPSGGAVRVWLGNHGRTAATNVVLVARFFAFDPKARGGLAPEETRFEIGTAAISPGEDRFPIRLPMRLTKPHLDALRWTQAGAITVMSGAIQYDDGFGKREESQLCFSLQSGRKDWQRCTPKFKYSEFPPKN